MSDDTAENLAESLEAELSAIEGGAGDDGPQIPDRAIASRRP